MEESARELNNKSGEASALTTVNNSGDDSGGRCGCCTMRCCLVFWLVIAVIFGILTYFATRPPDLPGKGWIGPDRVPGELWGGPTKKWIDQEFFTTIVPADGIEKSMNYAKTGSNIPEGLHGIFWIDQYGASSVVKDPSYGYKWPLGTAEMLVSFGEGVPTYQNTSKCMTPIPMWYGPNWGCQANEAGEYLAVSHQEYRNTLSFCFMDESMQSIQLQLKSLAETAAWGPFVLGPYVARLLGYLDAGNGYYWTGNGALNMTMIKHSWGWDRQTEIFGQQQRSSWLSRWAASELMPGPAKNVLNGAADKPFGEGHYPVVQIVDGAGRRTKYYAEWLDWLIPRKGGQNVSMRMPSASIDSHPLAAKSVAV